MSIVEFFPFIELIAAGWMMYVMTLWNTHKWHSTITLKVLPIALSLITAIDAALRLIKAGYLLI